MKKEQEEVQYLQYILLSDGDLPEDDLPIDELDTLFEQLPQLEVPPSLIARILDTPSRLPRPPHCIPKEELGILLRIHLLPNTKTFQKSKRTGIALSKSDG